MANGKDASEDSMQASRFYGTVDPGVAHAKPPQLRSTDHSMLPARQRGQRLTRIGVPFPRYAVIRHTAVEFSPCLSGKMEGVTGNGTNGELRLGAYQPPQERL